MATTTKTSLKKSSRAASKLSHLIHLVQFVKCWQFFVELNSKDCFQSKFRKRKRKPLSCVHVLHKTWIETYLRHSCAVTAKKCTNNLDARAELLFCQSKPIAFLPFSLTSYLSLSKLPVAVPFSFPRAPGTRLKISVRESRKWRNLSLASCIKLQRFEVTAWDPSDKRPCTNQLC